MKAYEVLEQFDWCRGSYAKDKAGHSVVATSDSAVAFCAEGAIIRAHGTGKSFCEELFKARMVFRSPVGALDDSTFTEWNDDPKRTKEEVIELLKKAGV